MRLSHWKENAGSDNNSRSRINDFVDDWGSLVAIAGVIGAVILGFRVATIGTLLAYIIALGLPLTAVTATAWPHLTAMPRAIGGLGVAAGIAVALATEAAVVSAVFPPTADAELELSVGERGLVTLPAGDHRLSVSAHGQLDSTSSADYRIDLARGANRVAIEGQLEKSYRQGRRVRGIPTGSSVVHETDRHEVRLAGDGPVEVTLTSLTGTLTSPLHVAISRVRRWPIWAAWGAVGLVALAVLIQAAARRRGHASYLALGCGIAAAFAALFPSYYNPDSRLGFVIGAGFFGVVAGSVGGGILGRLIGGPIRKRAT